MESLDLPEQLAHPLRTGRQIEIVGRIVLTIAVEGDQLPGLPIPQPLQEFLATVAVAAHQSHAHLEVLLRRLRREFDDPLRGRTVDRHRLLHERVHALLDGVGKVRCPKRRRRGEQRDVARPEAIDRLLVPVETDEGPLFGHIDAFLKLLAQRPLHDLGPVAKHVRHRHHLDRCPRDGKRIDRRTTATAAAADQRHADFIRAGGMDEWDRPAGEERARQGGRRHCRGGGLRSCAEEFTTAGGAAER